MSDAVNCLSSSFKLTDLKNGSVLMYQDDYTCTIEFNKGYIVVTKDDYWGAYRCYDLRSLEDRKLFISHFGNLCLSFVGKPASEVYND